MNKIIEWLKKWFIQPEEKSSSDIPNDDVQEIIQKNIEGNVKAENIYDQQRQAETQEFAKPNEDEENAIQINIPEK